MIAIIADVQTGKVLALLDEQGSLTVIQDSSLPEDKQVFVTLRRAQVKALVTMLLRNL